MIEVSCPFRYRPDVLFMELPKASESLKIQAFESQWGITDEILCYWNGVLFGQITRDNDRRFAKLLPTLDRLRNYTWPSVDAYASVMAAIMIEFPNLEVRCERDCDQCPVEPISTIDELLEKLRQVQEFCLEGRIECPSFSYRSPLTR